jgi:hypothetical protein
MIGGFGGYGVLGGFGGNMGCPWGLIVHDP